MQGKRQVFRSQYGRKGITVSAECPTFAIRRKLGNVHVGTPDAAIEDMIRNAPGAQSRTDQRTGTAITDQQIAEAVRFALWQHAENRAEYGYVMGGSR